MEILTLVIFVFAHLVAHPIHADQKLTKKDVIFKWEHEHQEEFTKIKRLSKILRFLQKLNYESAEPVWLHSCGCQQQGSRGLCT